MGLCRNVIERLLYGKISGWIFLPYATDEIYRGTIENRDGINKTYLKWKDAMINGLDGELLPVEGLALWPGLSISRTPDEIGQQKFRKKPTIEEQVKRFTPQLQEYAFGKERTEAVVGAINARIDSITAQSHEYFTENNGSAHTEYTFIREEDTFPLLYTVRSKKIGR